MTPVTFSGFQVCFPNANLAISEDKCGVAWKPTVMAGLMGQ